MKQQKQQKPRKCLVLDCPNCSDAGVFIGDLCAPCHEALAGRGSHPARSRIAKAIGLHMGEGVK